jgi:hypothetical protein
MFFLRMPSSDTDVRILPDDKLLVLFEEGELNLKKAWTATVTEPLPYSPLATITGFITRPWDNTTGEYRDKRELKMIPWKDLKGPKESLRLTPLRA